MMDRAICQRGEKGRAPTSRTTVLLLAGMLSPPLLANAPPSLPALAPIDVPAGTEILLRVEPGDPDGDVPGLRLVDAPRGALFSDNGDGTRTFRWIPDNTDAGTREILSEAFDARDATLVARAPLQLTIRTSEDAGGNRAPMIESLIDRDVARGGSFDFRVVARDPEKIVPALNVDRLPPGASFTDNGDGTRQFRWRPGSAAASSTPLVFTASDALDPSLTDIRTITLGVLGDADVSPDSEGSVEQVELEVPPTSGDPRTGAPVFVGLVDGQLDLGDTWEFRVQPRDDDGTVPGLSIDRLPAGAAFDDNRDGTRTFRWKPYPIDLGDTYVTFNAIDANDPTLRTSQTVRLTTVRNPDRPVNFHPVINGIRNPVVRVGDTLLQRVKPVDPDFTVPQLVVLDRPAGASFSDSGDGTRTLRWTVGPDDLGDTEVSFLARDAEDLSRTAERTISIRVEEPSAFDVAGTRLRQLADERDFRIGFASVLQAVTLPDNQLYRDIAASEFNIVTPENAHKMGYIQPERGEFEWEDADELANWAQANGMDLHGHPLVWFAQLPGWVQRLEPAEAEPVMLAHIDALVSRYKGRIDAWDVVNEALEDDGALRRSIWYRGMGEAYIGKAFRAARALDPDATLIYNDYDVAWENAKSDGMYELLRRELAAGTPIDAVGFQVHLRGDFDLFESMERNLRRFADLGLEIFITEFDVAMDGEPDLDQQADVYRRVLEICLDEPACRTMQAWGFTDRYSWRAGFKPLLFTDYYRAKPAYKAWQETLENYAR